MGGGFATLGLMVGALRPQDIDAGEGPAVALGIGLLVGLVSGATFGAILSLVENRRAMLDLPLIRVALWGALAAAVWPLATRVDDGMTIILCPLGAVCAATAVVIARRAGPGDPGQPRLLKWLGHLIARPVREVCGANG